MLLARAFTKVVFPTPGMSSINIWPLASMAINTFSITSSFPRMTFFILSKISMAFFIIHFIPLFCQNSLNYYYFIFYTLFNWCSRENKGKILEMALTY